jgi:hypothetical protein
MNAENNRLEFVDYLRRNYLGPVAGTTELLPGRPDKTYLVGTLFPRGTASTTAPANLEFADDPMDDAPVGDDGMDEQIETSNAYHPSSVALTFVHDGAEVEYAVDLAIYAPETEDEKVIGWRRVPLSNPARGRLTPTDRTARFEHSGVPFQVASRWRTFGQRWLVTVSVENLSVHREEDGPVPTESCAFQASLSCTVVGGDLLPYNSASWLDRSEEELELDLRYRDKKVYGVGHGCAVDWSPASHEVHVEFLPMVDVPAIAATSSAAPILRLDRLADTDLEVTDLTAELNEFIDDYERWVQRQAAMVQGLDVLERAAALRLVSRQRAAISRMRGGVDLLAGDDLVRGAFRVAMQAMRMQMEQTRANAGEQPATPTWRPFQLGFLLTSIASTAAPDHDDRELVDLIWFPTGGGKTEAYLALAAFEMVRRRLARGNAGGGTAVITRYTLRLLTTQQFQRAASLICSLELLRRSGAAPGPAYSIGLWLGAETTPNDIKEAKARLENAYRQQPPRNPFQLEACPWCGTAIFPLSRTQDRARYGAEASSGYFKLYCPNTDCGFHDELPVLVVDEQIYRNPPSMLVATIDKFARLPVLPKAGSLFGLDTAITDAPSLIIQDELHLLSGPLGTVMALYESAIESLIAWSGSRPKIVASTATVRAATDQVKGLFARDVEVYPPAGISADDSYFGAVDHTRPGRLYLGLMPQTFTQATSVVRSLTALLEAPGTLSDRTQEALDSYWTVVVYHNSLRELGRTVTIARDDVQSALRARGGDDARSIDSTRSGGVRELTSRVAASELPGVLRALGHVHGEESAIDVVACTNMLSVGIDVPRLGVMLMNGQPKTTSEYIQATSRVGRGRVPGVVVTLFRATKPRDRSHYETFRAYHEALYRAVEPTSVTPWTIQARRRALAATLVTLIRHGAGLRDNASASAFDPASSQVVEAVNALKSIAARVDPDEAGNSANQIDDLVNEWGRRAASKADGPLTYNGKENPLIKDFGQLGQAWPIMNSMRDVDAAVRVIVRGEER